MLYMFFHSAWTWTISSNSDSLDFQAFMHFLGLVHLWLQTILIVIISAVIVIMFSDVYCSCPFSLVSFSAQAISGHWGAILQRENTAGFCKKRGICLILNKWQPSIQQSKNYTKHLTAALTLKVCLVTESDKEMEDFPLGAAVLINYERV